jgi:hypothetical protein
VLISSISVVLVLKAPEESAMVTSNSYSKESAILVLLLSANTLYMILASISVLGISKIQFPECLYN